MILWKFNWNNNKKINFTSNRSINFPSRIKSSLSWAWEMNLSKIWRNRLPKIVRIVTLTIAFAFSFRADNWIATLTFSSSFALGWITIPTQRWFSLPNGQVKNWIWKYSSSKEDSAQKCIWQCEVSPKKDGNSRSMFMRRFLSGKSFASSKRETSSASLSTSIYG